MGPTDAHASSSPSAAASSLVCRGLVRIRQQTQLSSSKRGGNAILLDARGGGNGGDASRLQEDEWYFCVLKADASAVIQWFSIRGEGDASDDDDEGGPADGKKRSDSVLVAATAISHFEVVDDSSASDKAHDSQDDAAENDHERESIAEFNGLKLDAEGCTFYMEDHVNGYSYLCEVESETERASWAQSITGKLQICSPNSRTSSSPSSSPTVFDSQDSPDTRQAKRPLIRMQTSNMDDEDDPFGLLSLTKSAFSSTTSDQLAAATDDGSSRVNRTAPGFFTFTQIEIREESERKEDDIESSKSSNDSTPRANATKPERLSSLNNSSVFSNGGMGQLSAAAPAVPDKNHCLRCQKRIGSLFRSAKVCSSCDNRFCRLHCNQYAIITSLPKPKNKKKANAAKKLTLVCVDCLVRQKLLTSICELTTYYEAVVGVGGMSRLVRWKFFAQKPKLDLAKHMQCWELGPLSLLSAMFKYRQHPFMFVVVLAQLVKNVEYCVETMDFYWPQFLQWGFIHLADAPPSVQTHYLFFLAATCRRCVHLAVKATWECIAAHWDAMTSGAFERGHFIIYMLFFVTQVSFGEARSVLHQLLFSAAPAHQLNELETLLAKLYEVTREIYVMSMRDSPYFSWLLARSEEEILASSKNVRQQLFVNRDFLDPFPVDSTNVDQQQAALVARKSLGLAHLVDTKVNIANTPALHIFSDVMQLVRFLVDLTTFLKESTPVPSERKLRLPNLLEEMLEGQHIRPEAYLPLVPIVSTLHRVVNVLTDEGTVFSTKARAPTLVFFEVINSDISDAALRECFRKNTNPHAQSAVRHRQSTSVSVAKHFEGDEHYSNRSAVHWGSHLDVLNFLDANIVETFMADLAPATIEDESNNDSIIDDPEGLQLFKVSSAASIRPSSQQSAEDIVGVMDESEGAKNDQQRWTTLAAEKIESPSSNSSTTSSRVGEPCRFFGERFEQMKERIRCQSHFSKYPGWSVLPVIAKSFDDMRQEVFVLQGLKICQLIFQKHNLDLWLRYYSIVCAGKDCGLLEVITDAQSLDALKKKAGSAGKSFLQIFQEACGRNPVTGQLDPIKLEEARQNFIVSMAAYSLFSYVFLIKDRHNGNILLDTEGHIVHIDFGFVLGIAPGNTFSLETAPFKLTNDMIDVIGHPGSKGFETYKQLIHQGLVALHLEAKQILTLVYLSSKDSNFPCFTATSRARIIRRLERRLCVGWTLQDVANTASHIVDKSYNHRGTKQYDWFQQLTNGIAP